MNRRWIALVPVFALFLVAMGRAPGPSAPSRMPYASEEAARAAFAQHGELCKSTTPGGRYFQGLDAELKLRGLGRPVMILDLDRLDHNIEALRMHLGTSFQYRAVDKSLPSAPLLRYLLEATGSHGVMAFHPPFLRILLSELPADTDILFGKTVPVAAAREALAGLSPELRAQAFRRVSWLVDSPETVDDFLDFAFESGGTLNVSVELDVGLHRGGAQKLADFEAMLDRIRGSGGRLRLTGLMGYDGHVAHVPVPDIFSLLKDAMLAELGGVERTYRSFVDDLRAKYPDLYATARVFNGGGSETYELYQPGSVMNDLAVGSALLKPQDFDILTLDDHLPAAFVASPILKRMHPAEIAIIGRISFNGDDDGFYVYGGAWNTDPIYPSSLHSHFLTRGSPNLNLVSNQSFLWGNPNSEAPGLKTGDFVFYRPLESDAIFGFEDILAVRGGKVVDVWHPFSVRY